MKCTLVQLLSPRPILDVIDFRIHAVNIRNLIAQYIPIYLEFVYRKLLLDLS
jgi:hypothetical protein